MKLVFKKKGLVYLPVSLLAWFFVLIYLGVNAYTIYRIAVTYNSVYSSLIRYFPYFVCFTVVLFWIAEHFREENK